MARLNHQVNKESKQKKLSGIDCCAVPKYNFILFYTKDSFKVRRVYAHNGVDHEIIVFFNNFHRFLNLLECFRMISNTRRKNIIFIAYRLDNYLLMLL